MAEHQSSRTLVKSAPELWAECSDAASLARHLGAVGEIRITRLEPETTVAWEGAAASGTVNLEPSGWGTRVTMTMVQEAPAAPSAAVEPPPAAEPVEPQPAAAEPQLEAAELPERRSGMLARLRVRWRRAPDRPLAGDDVTPARAAASVEAASVEAVDEPPPVIAGDDALAAALDSLGRAHHRPYSRS